MNKIEEEIRLPICIFNLSPYNYMQQMMKMYYEYQEEIKEEEFCQCKNPGYGNVSGCCAWCNKKLKEE